MFYEIIEWNYFHFYSPYKHTYLSIKGQNSFIPNKFTYCPSGTTCIQNGINLTMGINSNVGLIQHWSVGVKPQCYHDDTQWELYSKNTITYISPFLLRITTTTRNGNLNVTNPILNYFNHYTYKGFFNRTLWNWQVRGFSHTFS